MANDNDRWAQEHPGLNTAASAVALVIIWLVTVLGVAAVAHVTVLVWRVGWNLVR